MKLTEKQPRSMPDTLLDKSVADSGRHQTLMKRLGLAAKAAAYCVSVAGCFGAILLALTIWPGSIPAVFGLFLPTLAVSVLASCTLNAKIDNGIKRLESRGADLRAEQSARAEKRSTPVFKAALEKGRLAKECWLKKSFENAVVKSLRGGAERPIPVGKPLKIKPA